MKLELDAQDVELIAQRVAELLKPLLVQEKGEAQEEVLSVKGLAAFLGVTEDWVYKQVSLKRIPYFKSGKYTKFRRSEIERWMKSHAFREVLRVVRT